ncbi:hypothetical protein L3Q65_46215 [Amycolatopsis sp. FU40]|uniref:hypothetical protein n=1 Tax=Amycolatopsis sp. FU40 TaxID=2914159 RepID=UPI001F410010|nr:hypothetical protein [Amycolatopsis sp. FU40]UKD55171.1 hypothetical protein L3Q65_46215 [Amycolatopsis sp. FU40]
MKRQDRLSREYVRAKVAATLEDGTPVDPATLQIELAVVLEGTRPAAGDWRSAVSLGSGVFGVLVGPGAVELAPADYETWHRITDTTEQPVAPFGKLRIT